MARKARKQSVNPNTKPLEALQALDKARESPAFEGLSNYLDFHHALLRLQWEVEGGLPAIAREGGEDRQRKLAAGLPQLTFDRLAVGAEVFTWQAKRLLDLFQQYYPDLVEQMASLRERGHDEWLTQAQEVFQDGSAAWGTAALPDLSLAVSSLALTPYLRRAAAQVSMDIDTSTWRRGTCAVCGGHPDWSFLEASTGERHLVCGRCDHTWVFPRVQCPYCGCEDHRQLGFYPTGEGEAYRLYTCDECHRYIKARDLRKGDPKRPFAIERVLTIGMDIAAQEKQYRPFP